MGFLSDLPCLFPVLLYVKFGEQHQQGVPWARLGSSTQWGLIDDDTRSYY